MKYFNWAMFIAFIGGIACTTILILVGAGIL